jgi:hypothetical protein
VKSDRERFGLVARTVAVDRDRKAMRGKVFDNRLANAPCAAGYQCSPCGHRLSCRLRKRRRGNAAAGLLKSRSFF